MFARFLPTRSPRRRNPLQVRHYRPQLEAFESRDCPSGISITSLTATPEAAQMVRILGHVEDSNTGATAVVNLSGAFNDAVAVDGQGNFSADELQPSQPDTVTAVAVDSVQDTSDAVTAAVPAAVSITSLTVTPEAGQMVRISGQVQDNNPGATVTITLSGAVSDTVSVDSNGNFSADEPQPTQPGTLTAVAVDNLQDTSDAAPATVLGAVTITNLTVTPQADQMVRISGQVQDNNPDAYVLVTFSGAVTDTVCVDINGNFSADEPQPTQPGNVTALANDGYYDASAAVTAAVPAAVTITSLTVTPEADQMVQISGQVQDNNPGATLTITLSGAISDTVSVDSNGNFCVDEPQPTQPGTVTAVAVDNLQDTSDAATAAMPAAVIITSLTVTPEADQMVQISGQVQDNNPGATLTITLSGAISDTVSVDSNGNFCVDEPQPSQPGTLTAVAVDNLQNTSNATTAAVSGAVVITALTVTPEANQMVQISGQVQNNNPGATVTVTLSGAVSDTVSVDSNGNFCVAEPQSTQPGTVTAVASDNLADTSDAASASDPAEVTITSLTVTPVTGTVVQVSGQVEDNNPGATVTVTFTGAASGTANVNADGSFSVQLVGTQLGTVTAVAVDSLEDTSDAATAELTCDPPEIVTFRAVNGIGTLWTFSGMVVAQTASNVPVVFGGLSIMQNQLTTTANDGTFSITVDLQGQNGQVTAMAVDCWGQQSDLAFVLAG